MNFFDVIKTVYKKNGDLPLCDTQLCITLNKWLGFDKDNLAVIKSLLPYMFFVEPKHYFILLYCNIRQKARVPFFKKIEKKKVKENKLYEKMRYVLGWSKKELNYNTRIVEKVLEPKVWKKKLGVK